MISRRWLIASGALAGLYTLGALGHKAKDYYCASAKWPANKRQLDQDLAATFSEEQRQLLKALAPFYDTFCFGDGRHGEAEIAFSFYTKKMMKFLFDIGVRKFFTEAYIGSNDKLSKFKKREMSVKEFMAFCKDELAGMAPADFENHALCVRKADLIASTEPLPEIIAADHRNENS
ncbi:MAG: hypothetical protein HY053_03970, partial [Proteobacteria bacterium]|nr:hypothetical protein [Pseudomonadota bacterium]